MTNFYTEGRLVGEVRFDKVLVGDANLVIDETLLNRCKMQGIELIAFEDGASNRVKYAGVNRLLKELQVEGVSWKIGGGIRRFWNGVQKIIENRKKVLTKAV